MNALPELPWIAVGRAAIGQVEIPGGRHNPFIVGIWSAIGVSWFKDDETPWCAGFVAYCLKKAGKPILGPAKVGRALAWKDYGTRISAPAYGCIAVKSRTGGGHVGFVVGRFPNGKLAILGGNQNNRVSIAAYDQGVFAFRWPGTAPLAGRYELPIIKTVAVAAGSEA